MWEIIGNKFDKRFFNMKLRLKIGRKKYYTKMEKYYIEVIDMIKRIGLR